MTTPPFFYPPMQLIFVIARGNPTIITTFSDHGYLSGLVVRIVIPSASRATPGFMSPASLGMPQINGQIGEITVLGPNVFSFPIDSTGFTPYGLPGFPVHDRW